MPEALTTGRVATEKGEGPSLAPHSFSVLVPILRSGRELRVAPPALHGPDVAARSLRPMDAPLVNGWAPGVGPGIHQGAGGRGDLRRREAAVLAEQPQLRLLEEVPGPGEPAALGPVVVAAGSEPAAVLG